MELVRLAKEQGLSLTGPDGLVKQSPRACSNTQRWASMRTARGSVQPVAMSVTANVWQKSPPPPRVPALMADQVDLDEPGLGVIPINPGADPHLTQARWLGGPPILVARTGPLPRCTGARPAARNGPAVA